MDTYDADAFVRSAAIGGYGQNPPISSCGWMAAPVPTHDSAWHLCRLREERPGSTAACTWCQATWRSASCHQPEDSFKPAGGSRWEETVVPGVSSIVVDLQITSDLPLRDVMGRYGKHPPWEVKVYRSGLVVDASCDHGWHWYEQQQQETDNRLHSVCDGCQVWSVKMLENVNPYLPPTSSLARRLAYTRAHTLHVHHTRMLVLTYSKRKKEWIRRGWELDILRKSMNTETQSAVVSLYT